MLLLHHLHTNFCVDDTFCSTIVSLQLSCFAIFSMLLAAAPKASLAQHEAAHGGPTSIDTYPASLCYTYTASLCDTHPASPPPRAPHVCTVHVPCRAHRPAAACTARCQNQRLPLLLPSGFTSRLQPATRFLWYSGSSRRHSMACSAAASLKPARSSQCSTAAAPGTPGTSSLLPCRAMQGDQGHRDSIAMAVQVCSVSNPHVWSSAAIVAARICSSSGRKRGSRTLCGA